MMAEKRCWKLVLAHISTNTACTWNGKEIGREVDSHIDDRKRQNPLLQIAIG